MAEPDARPAEDRGRFEEIYDVHVVPIYRFIHARVGNRPDAEDLTAQVFMRAVEQLDTTRQPGQIASWLYRVSQNAIADYWRAFYRLPVIGTDYVAPGWEPRAAISREPSDEQAAADKAATRRVKELLAQLPQRYAEVLKLRFLLRLSVAETAERMGISHGNAKILQYRALRKAALLGDTDG
jgi:RNA polymerase sigma-70 factor (ECF subfamily)